ncbi:alpha/beta fold hydrolase [Amycolatopsis sp. FDAARGOS 1241]|uniref:alpha/beta fold hydrolase n=1 Tax=Amycolatopsis sp. FDAARGOS 1241 TaxID=2778070 RepID=UPI00194DD318|nr:alpha/beta fold hydrolase [Amycolatopsis sp. FDAARGOS 1241]QRP44577.1 alpha/beta fold hydrolase [Amycolatopsis sp. FDAARGOS 1241]
MPKIRLLVPVVAAVAMVPLLPALASAQGLDWKPCASIAKGWDPDDQRTECALVPVPLDYAAPGGRTIDIAVSRIRATGERTGSIVFNPGGPGQSGMKMPLTIAGSKASGLLEHHDLIGFDPRGVDYSASLACDEDDAQPDPALSEKDQARFAAEHRAAANAACFAKDPALVKSFTTPNIARDVDRIREALGEDKIGYYGVSWGTALGAEYRTLFDSHVDKMLLDSVMPPELSVKTMDDGQAEAGENTFREFAAWLARYDSAYHFGTTEPQVEKALLALRDQLAGHPRPGPDGSPVNGDTVNQLFAYPRRQWVEAAGQLTSIRAGGAPGSRPAAASSGFGWDTERTGGNSFQQNALLCNESPSPRDFDTVWQDRLDRLKANPETGGFGIYEQLCVGWPVPATQWHFTPGKSPLQLVGHTYEPVTPIGWAFAMQRQIGGSLLTVEDDAHGSLSSLPCASAAVTFFDTGKPATQSCPGDPIPAPQP